LALKIPKEDGRKKAQEVTKMNSTFLRIFVPLCGYLFVE
jgi:hypothetical protein